MKNRIKNMIKSIRNFFRIFNIHMRELSYDLKYCGFHKDKKNKTPWRILLLAHSLEKGLSIPNKREKFGEDKASDLLRYLKMYEQKDFVYNEGVAVLNAYIKDRKEHNLSYEEFEIHEVEKNIEGGVTAATPKDLDYNFEDFKNLCSVRHSVREYSDEYVTCEEIEKAINLAITSPSACNRQMIKVYYSDNIDANKKLSQQVPGNTGFKEEKAKYLFLTADRSAFDYYELDQWYLNGGIFVAYLQLALTAEKIGSCIYQWPKDKKREKAVKEILNIPDNEIVVSVLGVGHYKENFNILKATRKDIKDVLINKKKEE